jgi:hypothetical protein
MDRERRKNKTGLGPKMDPTAGLPLLLVPLRDFFVLDHFVKLSDGAVAVALFSIELDQAVLSIRN